MMAFDGNESLKCLAQIGDRAVGDTRVFTDSDYYLEPSFVDSFANEVKSRRVDPIPNDDSVNTDNISEDGDDDPTLASCADNWKAARSDSKKQAWGIFRVNGLFASACRHSFVLWIADMIRSGEQYVAVSSALLPETKIYLLL
jgi:Kyakuja-Dileera-Zisupton transposase